jgi:hypothetical protein
VAVVYLFIGGIVSSFWIGPTYAAIQALTPNHRRFQASALLLFILDLICMGLSPLVVVFLSDQLAPACGDESIRYTMLISLVTVVVCSMLYWMGGEQYRSVVQADRGVEQGPSAAVL